MRQSTKFSSPITINKEYNMSTKKNKSQTFTINVLKTEDGKWIDEKGQPIPLGLKKKEFLKGKKEVNAKDEMSLYHIYLAKIHIIKSEDVLHTKSPMDKIDDQIERLKVKREKMAKGEDSK